MKKVQMGVVGLRFGAHIVLNQILHGPGQPYADLRGICDLDPQRVREITAHHAVPVYATLDAMLADPAIEAVGLFTPPHGRAELIRKIVRAGKHVLTTKPFEVDSEAAIAVLAEARRLRRAVHINSPGPVCPPELAQILAWQQEYNLGRAVAGQAETWASYHEQDDDTWFCDPVKCPAAPILRIGIYCINDLVHVFGPAETVQVMHSRIRTGRPTADNAQMLIGFAEGVIGSVFASFCIQDGNPYGGAKRISYERGTVYCNMGAPGDDPHHIELQLVMGQGNQRRVIDHASVEIGQRSGTYQWENLLRVIRGGVLEQEIAPIEIAAGVAILDAMARASISGRTETVAAVGIRDAAPAAGAVGAVVGS